MPSIDGEGSKRWWEVGGVEREERCVEREERCIERENDVDAMEEGCQSEMKNVKREETNNIGS